MRIAGLLMPVSALPSSYGIGDLGKGCRDFIDYLQECSFRIWQILPLNPLGYGNSPYQPLSSFAGDPVYISLEKLHEEGLLEKLPRVYKKTAESTDYEAVRKYKKTYLKKAFLNFKETEEYKQFISQEWVYPYAVFVTLKEINKGKCWHEWSEEQKNWIIDKSYDLKPYEDLIRFQMFLQYEFYRQWMEVREYADEAGIEIMGDIPFYVGLDSADVWMNQDEFLLGADAQPTFIAGVPPDYFSKNGQRWGNPIYNWEHMKENGFKFWIKRFGYTASLFDIIRIDHFRAFDTYWKIAADCETAIEGEWIEAPGYEFFDTLLDLYPDVKIVAEDLGDMRDEVYRLRDYYDFPGMKIVQFAFDPEENNNSFPDRENMIVYTGTHDNETIVGWFENQPKKVQDQTEKLLKEAGYSEGTIAERFLRYSFDSVAVKVIIPVQDVLELDNKARFNVPGTIGSPNWEWKLKNFNELNKKKEFLKELVKNSRRELF